MIQLGELVTILDLRRQGLSVSAISRQCGADRKTIRKYIEKGLETPAYPVRRRLDDDGPVLVSDDWPAFVPINERELRVIEGHFAKELDALFGPLR